MILPGEYVHIAKTLLKEFKAEECAYGCGATNPQVMQNSHKDENDKTRKESTSSGSVKDNVWSIAEVKNEQPKMRAECANCHQKFTAVKRRSEKTPYNELNDSSHQRHRDEMYARINEFKTMSSCYKCLLRDPDCLLIDHFNRWGKRWRISKMINDDCDWIDIVEEMENGECCVMCHNCHQIKGFVEGEFC